MVSSTGPDDSPNERVSALIDAPLRRHVVRTLITSDRVATCDDLARTFVDADESHPDIPSGENAAERVANVLHHHHLPKLADGGVIEYDQRTGDVVFAPDTSTTAAVVSRLDQRDRHPF